VLVKKRNKDRGLTDAEAQEARAIVRNVAEPVSELTTNRLSVYLRCLNVLDASGVRTISSQAMAEQFHLTASQIRKDLAYFGEFGVRGVGYYVKIFLAQGEGSAVRAAMRAEPPREGDAPRLFKKKTRRDQKTTTVGEITSFPH
jgi:hypothetical protein